MGNAKNGKKSRFAGLVARPLVAKREAMDLRIKVDPRDLARVDDLMTSVLGACDSVEASAKQIVESVARPQQRFHRRVRIIVEDAAGVEVSSSTSNLHVNECLEAEISGDAIVTTARKADL